MAEINFQDWMALYLQALQEPLGSADFSARVKDAEISITRRMQALRTSAAENGERKAIADALRSLRYIKNENFKHSAGFESQQARPE
jgi:hypothetical protein